MRDYTATAVEPDINININIHFTNITNITTIINDINILLFPAPGMVQTRSQFEFCLMAVAEETHAILKALPQ